MEYKIFANLKPSNSIQKLSNPEEIKINSGVAANFFTDYSNNLSYSYTRSTGTPNPNFYPNLSFNNGEIRTNSPGLNPPYAVGSGVTEIDGTIYYMYAVGTHWYDETRKSYSYELKNKRWVAKTWDIKMLDKTWEIFNNSTDPSTQPTLHRLYKIQGDYYCYSTWATSAQVSDHYECWMKYNRTKGWWEEILDIPWAPDSYSPYRIWSTETNTYNNDTGESYIWNSTTTSWNTKLWTFVCKNGEIKTNQSRFYTPWKLNGEYYTINYLDYPNDSYYPKGPWGPGQEVYFYKLDEANSIWRYYNSIYIPTDFENLNYLAYNLPTFVYNNKIYLVDYERFTFETNFYEIDILKEVKE